MEKSFLPTLGASRAKGSFRHRSNLVMWAVAALLVVLAFALPWERTVWAADPTIEVEVIDLVVPEGGDFKQLCLDFDEATYDTTETVEYETACLKITATGVNEDKFPDLDWRLIVDYETNTYDNHSPPNKRGGPGYVIQEGQERYSIAPGQYEYDATAETVTAMVKLEWLVPASDYTLDVRIADKDGDGEDDKAETSTTFSTKSGCVPHPDGATLGRWFSPAGPGWISDSTITRTSMVVRISANHNLAPLNSGRCMYYEMEGNGETVKGSAYVYYRGSGGRTAWIFPTGLEPSTYYRFTITPDPAYGGYRAGFGAYTKGPRLTIEFTDIEQTTATVNVNLPAGELEKMGERQVHLVYYEAADENELHRQQVKPTPKTTVDGSTSFSLSNLTAATEYKVKASLSSAFPTYQTESGFFPTKPDKPTGVTLAPGDEKLDVSWTKPTGGDAINFYTVEWQAKADIDAGTGSPSFSSAIAVTETTYEITGLTNGTEYGVRVTASNNSGHADSDYAYATPAGLPSEPKNLSVTPGNKRLTLSWQEPDELGGGITGYEVQSKKADDSNAVWATSSVTVDSETDSQSNITTYSTTITGLDFSTKYDVRVRAKNSITKTNEEDYDWAESTGTTIPDVPTGLAVESGNQQLTLLWKEPADLGSVSISDYVVQYRKTSDTSWSTNSASNQESTDSQTSVTTYSNTITGLDYSTEYDLRVRADNDVTLQDEANYNWAEKEGQTIPNSPGNLEVVPGNEQLTLSWDAPAASGSLIINGYVVQYKKTADSSWQSLSTLSASTVKTTIGSLDNDVPYSVRVRAVNIAVLEDEDGYNWANGSGTPVPAPIVTGVTVADSTITQTEATATVEIDNQTGESQAVHLQYRKKTDTGWTPASPKTVASTVTSETFDLSSLTGNTRYVVEAWLATTSDTKESVEFTTDPVEPDPPTMTGIEHGDRKLTVTWNKPGDGGSQITGYKIEWTVKGQNSWTSKSVNAPNALEGSTNQVLLNGTEYTVQVKAVNSVGDSQPSNSMDETPSTVPSAPSIQSVTPGDTKLTVTWNKPANGGSQITNYILQWKDNSVTGWASPLGTRTVGKDVFTTNIGSLSNGTTYAIQVRAKNKNDAGPWSVEDTGTPRPDPSVDSVGVPDGTITQTTAIATVNIADPTGDLKIVHLRYRINSSSETWTTPTPQSTSTNNVVFPQFTGLKSDTEYRVEASFDSNFVTGVKHTTFTTKRPTVSDVDVADSTIEQTEATATVTIQAPNDRSQTVYLRYRPTSQSDWSTTASDAGTERGATSTSTVDIDISGLKPDTEYEVEVSLETNYSQSKMDTFTTDPPTLTGIIISEVMQQSAKAAIAIDEPHGRSLPVYVRFRKVTDPVNEVWTRKDTSSTMASAVSSLTDLTSGTKYEAQASLDTSFPDTEGVTVTSDPFTTEGPSLTGLSSEAEMTGATITATIQAPNDESQTIHYRYRPTSQTDWGTTATDAGSDSTTSVANSDSAEFILSNLTSSTEYEVEASFDSNLDSSTRVVSVTFSTTSPNTSIKNVEASDRTQTTAKVTVTVSNPDTNGNAVYLHYRKVDQTAWSTPSDTDDSDPDEAEFTLDDLDAHTHYEVEVALDVNFTSSKTTITFWTLREPEISSVNAVDVTKTTAKAVVDILYPDGTERTVHLRYQEKAAEGESQDWPNALTEEALSSTSTAEKILTPLTAGTIYLLQASFDDSFPNTGTEETEFTTKHLPSVSSVRIDADTVTKTSATAIVDIADPDGVERPVYLQYRKKDQMPEDDWSDPPLDEDTDTGSVSIAMASLDPGTEYEVQASFDNTFPENGTKETAFTTKHQPSISGVKVDPNSITKTTATAEVSISNPDGTTLTVHLRYVVYSAMPDWDNDGTEVTATSDTGTAAKGLENLLAGTTYILQASFDTNFATGVRSTTFSTTPEPSASSVSVGSITKTTATATVNIANPDGISQTVHLQYRRENAAANDAWEVEQPETTTSGSVDFPLSSLTEGTAYDVEAWLARDTSHKVTITFTTAQDAPPPQVQNPPPGSSDTQTPSISSVSVDNITKTTARAVVRINDHDGSTQTAKLQYRTTSPQGQWSTPPLEESSTGATAQIDLSGLTADTAYEVQAWLVTDVNNKKTDTFRTLQTQIEQRTPEVPAPSVPAPSVLSVTFGNITQTSAVATINITNAGTAQKTARLQYRIKGTTSWSTPPNSDKTGGSKATISLAGLTSSTTYEVQAWLNSNSPPSGAKVYKFNTLANVPSVSSVTFDNIAQTSADATVNIDNAGTAQKTVRLHYRVDGTTAWSTPAKAKKASGSSTTISLTGLTAGTTYEVQAWLSSSSPPSGTQIYTFDTVTAPSISDLSVENVEQTSATTVVEIADAGTDMKQVYLRHSVASIDEWALLPFPTITYTDSTSIDLTELEPDTTYHVMVDLTVGFDKPKSVTFTTLAPPSLSGVSIGSATQTSAVATVSIANAGNGQKTVLLQYRQFGESTWGVAESKTVSGSSAAFNLTGLEPRTSYEVKVYLEAAPDAPEYTVFTTLSPDTSVSGISVGSITQTTAVATANIAYPGRAQKTVHLRYREFGESEWTAKTPGTTTGESVSFALSGLTPKTKYEVEASLKSDFSGSKSTTFTTLALEPVVSGIIVDDITQTTATAITTIANGDGTPQIIRVRYRTTSPQGAWSDTQETTSSTATANIELSGLAADTEYEVEVSLDADFGRAVSETFATLRYPSISDLEVKDETKNSATAVITIADSDGSAQTVHLRHRTTMPQGSWSDTQKITSSTKSI